MTQVFISREEFAETVIAAAVKVQRSLHGSRNDVAVSAMLIAAGAAMDRFAAQKPETTPENVRLLLVLMRDVVADITDYAVTPLARES